MVFLGWLEIMRFEELKINFMFLFLFFLKYFFSCFQFRSKYFHKWLLLSCLSFLLIFPIFLERFKAFASSPLYLIFGRIKAQSCITCYEKQHLQYLVLPSYQSVYFENDAIHNCYFPSSSLFCVPSRPPLFRHLIS